MLEQTTQESPAAHDVEPPGRRIGVAPYLAIDLLLCAVQVGILSLALSDGAKAGLVFGVQLLKIPATLWRLKDLGRSPDDALWALLPVANLALFSICLRATPSGIKRMRARASWEGQLTAIGALAAALPLMARTAGVGVPLSLAYAAVSGGVGRWVVNQLAVLEGMAPASLATLSTSLTWTAGFLVVYALIQLSKSATASRASWVPVLFLAPTIIVALVVRFIDQSKMGMGLAFMVFLMQAWGLLWASFGGAALVIGWLRSADRSADGGRAGLGEVLDEIRRRTFEVAGPHGTRVQAVAIGMQVVIPGIFYWLQLAFTDMLAVLHPDEPALAGSGRLTWGMRGRLFKLFLVSSLVGMAGAFAIGVLMGQSNENAGMALLGLSDPREPTMAQIFAQETWFVVQSWWQTLALLLLYRERRERRARREAPLKASEAGSANPYEPPGAVAGGGGS